MPSGTWAAREYMNEFLRQILEPDPVVGLLGLFLAFVAYVLLGLLPVLGAVYLIYFLLTLPMRRTERVRMFLNLLELGLKEGRSPPAAITEAAASRDPSLGARFHLLAAYLAEGHQLDEALARVPRLLPPQIRAMLKAGERIGDVAKVLPACRLLTQDSVSQVRGALNYVILLTFAVTPFAIFVPIVLKVKVLPAFRAIFADMLAGSQLPAFTRFVFAQDSWFLAIQTASLFLIWALTVAYLGGPRLHAWIERVLPGAPDFLFRMLPWRKKRLQRNFSAMLAVLLEANVPEADAVNLAAESTANSVMQRRAQKVVALLNQGISLPDALREMDDAGELHWRLKNALSRRGGFVRALAGWHDALEAKAFQLEQGAAQITTTLMVLLNGVIIASVVLAVFLALIQLLNRATLW